VNGKVVDDDMMKWWGKERQVGD